VSEEQNVDKVSDERSSQGQMGQRYLASGESVSMRLWENEQPGEPKPEAAREYETVGYVLTGRAELHLEGGS
jgi:quercetin dioxygenase-like cupin family protein